MQIYQQFSGLSVPLPIFNNKNLNLQILLPITSHEKKTVEWLHYIVASTQCKKKQLEIYNLGSKYKRENRRIIALKGVENGTKNKKVKRNQTPNVAFKSHICLRHGHLTMVNLFNLQKTRHKISTI